MRHPFGGVIPRVLNLSACCIGRTLPLAASVIRESGDLHLLDELLDLLVQTTDIRIRLCRSLVHLHSFDSGVVF